MTAQERQATNPLAGFRDRFFFEDESLIYLDGNSLGRQPIAARDLARRLVDHEWGERLIRGWGEHWMALPGRIGEKIGELLGARPGELVVADSTSVNLHKLALAAVNSREGRKVMLTDDLNFPSDLHVLAGIAASHDMELQVVPSPDGVHGPVDHLLDALDEHVALVCLSATTYRSGYTYDVTAVTAAAHEVGALVLWDLSHAAGSVPIDLGAADVDLAVGCTYKYLNGGPGSPAFLYVNEGLLSTLENPIPGWMGHADVFSFSPNHAPAEGVRSFLTGTPPVLSMAMIEPGVDLLLEAGMEVIRATSLDLTDFLLALFDEELRPRGFTLQSPRDKTRGSHVTIGHPDGLAIDQALIHEHQVIPDFRPPDGIRLGVAPLYVGFEDLEEAVRRIGLVMDTGAHVRFRGREVEVT